MESILKIFTHFVIVMKMNVADSKEFSVLWILGKVYDGVKVLLTLCQWNLC